jgi:hypothetical protein
LIKAGGNITTNGASLLVFFNDGNSSNNRDVVVYDGNDGIFASAFDGNFFGTSISGINYTSGNGALQLHVADGQNFADGALFINGLTLVPAGPIFNGVSVPGPNIANGNLWDIRTFSITSFLSPASPTLNLFSQTGSDCIALVVAVWDLPLGSAPGQTPAPTTLSVAPATGTFGGTVSLQATLRSNGVPVPGKSISFALNGTGVGSATTDASGVATLPSAPLGSINAATYTTGVGASFAGDPLFASSSGTAMLISR